MTGSPLFTLSKPEATVVTVEPTEPAKSREIGREIDSPTHPTSIEGTVQQDDSINGIAVESLSVGGSSIANTIDKYGLSQPVDGAARTLEFASMDDYKIQMLKDLDSCTSDNQVTRLFYVFSGTLFFGGELYEGSSKGYSKPIRLERHECELRPLQTEVALLSGQPYYTVVCFMLDYKAAGVHHLVIGGQTINLAELGPLPVAENALCVRVLLHCHVKSDLVIKTFQKDETTPGSFMICYVELSQNPPSEDSFDCILPRLPSPRRAFHIRHSITGDSSEQQLPATIRRVGISGSGSHAATLSKVGKKLLIDLWELRLSEAISRVSYPYSHTISSAHAIIDAETVLYQDVGLSLSWDGSLIVAFKTRQTSPGKIHVFEYYGDVYRPQSKGQQVSLPLEPSNCHKKCTLLQSFRGDAKFTNLSISKWDYHSQRFIACDREGFSVYKTTDQWEMLYHVPVFHMYSDRAISTAVGGIFTLEISIYQLSIWDLVTGAPKHLIDTKHRIVGHFLSVTGETLAIAAEEAIFLYSTESGDLLQQFSESCDWWYGFVDGDRGIYGSHPTRQRHAFFITDIRNPSRPKRLVDASLDWNRIVRDVKVGEESDGTNIMLTAVLSFRESILEVNFLEDTLEGTVDEPLCTSACASDRITTPAIAFGEEVSYSGGAFVVQEATYVSQKQLIMDIRFKDGKSKRFWWVANSCFFIKESSRFMTSLSNRSCTRFMTWKLPQSSQDELELIFFGRRDTSEDVIELSTCSHGGYPVLSTVGRDLWLYSREWLSLDDPNVLSEELWMITGGGTFQCNEAMEAEARYLCSFDNHYSTPGNHSKSLVPRVCRIHAGFNNNRARPILKTLLQANNWIPLKAYSRGSNPLGIILEEARTESTAIEVARMLIDYSLNKVKEDNDLVYILYLLECMDELAARYPDLALRITRGFCYIRCYDRKFIINNHRIARPPSLWQIWSSDASKVYECRNPILQLDIANQNFDQLNEGFTEDVFVAPVNLLWSFIPKSHSPCSEFPLGDPNQRTTWIQTLYNIIVLNMNPFSHVYIRPRPFSLEILDNPAVEAVIQYKWNTFAFVVWMTRFAAQSLYSLLVVSAALMQVYYRDKGPLLGVFSSIVVLSCVFLWLEFLQWQESHYFEQSLTREKVKGMEKKKKKKKKGPFDFFAKTSRWISGLRLSMTDHNQESLGMEPLEIQGTHHPYLRSPYNILDLITFSYPLATSIHQIFNIVHDKTEATTSDFSFSVVFVFLHLLAELRVSEVVCKYITIMFGIFHEIKVFSMVLATSTIFFTIAIVHAIHGKVNSLGNTTNPGLPNNFLGAISTVYLMMGGRFDPLNNDIYVEGEGDREADYRNGPLLLMMMVYFTFSSILMLNVLVALINNAFIKADDRWKQVWLENRLRYVETAENMSYHIPGFRETFDWFPKEIYYTATSYQVKQYWRRVAKVDEEIIFDGKSTDQSSKSTVTKEAGHLSDSKKQEGDLTRQDQDLALLDGISIIKEQFMQQEQYLRNLKSDISTEFQKSAEMSHIQGLQQMELDKRTTEANNEISEVKEELAKVNEVVVKTERDVSDMKMAMTETKREISEMKLAITKTNGDVFEMKITMAVS